MSLYDHIRWPARPWDEVYPGLWVGGAGYGRPPAGRFDVVLTVCQRWEEGNVPRGTVHRRFPMRDNHGPLDTDDLAGIVAWVVRQVRADRRVLVRCYMGVNRSALVGALALAELSGMSGAEAMAAVREVRGGQCLANRVFADLLTTIP